MEEKIRVHRRSKSRPFDLRRKVLLKNFLKEQMSYMPGGGLKRVLLEDIEDIRNIMVATDPTEDHSEMDESGPDSNAASDEHRPSNESDFNVSGGINLEDEIFEECDDDEKDDPTPKLQVKSKTGRLIIRPNLEVKSKTSMFKLASLLNPKKEFKGPSKGIQKAKNICKRVTRSFRKGSSKSVVDKVVPGRRSTSENVSSRRSFKMASKSLFSQFKHRREQKRQANEKDKRTVNEQECTKKPQSKSSTAGNQSGDTNSEVLKGEINKIKASNRRLRYENRMLSQSLSYYLSNEARDSLVVDYSSPRQSTAVMNNYNEQYIKYAICHDHEYSARINENTVMFHDYSKSSDHGNDRKHSLSRLSHSQSLNEYGKKIFPSKNNYHTRSVSRARSTEYGSPTVEPVSPFDEVTYYNQKTFDFSPTTITTSRRGILRRFSMPERIRENLASHPQHRSVRARGIHRRTPFYALPSGAFY